MKVAEKTVERLIFFVGLQGQLVKAIQEEFPEFKDWKYLTGFPRAGRLSIDLDKEWSFNRHGSGIRFTELNSNHVVDIHTWITRPEIFDAWRIAIYFDSLGQENPLPKGYRLGSGMSSEDWVKSWLKDLVNQEIIELLEEPMGYFSLLKKQNSRAIRRREKDVLTLTKRDGEL